MAFVKKDAVDSLVDVPVEWAQRETEHERENGIGDQARRMAHTRQHRIQKKFEQNKAGNNDQ